MLQEGCRLKILRWLDEVYDKGDGKTWTVVKIGTRYVALTRPGGCSSLDTHKYKLIEQDGMLFVCLTRRQFIQDRRFDADYKGHVISSGKLRTMNGNIVEYEAEIIPPPIDYQI